MKNSKKQIFWWIVLPAILAICIPLSAQDIFDEESEEDVYELSPFEIVTSGDNGYIATNSISGTRLNMKIKDVPLNLEVITNEFITDTGSTNLRDSLRYSAGLVLSSQSDAFANVDSDPQSSGANDPRGATRSAGDSTTKLRGFIGNSMLQDGFHRVYSADTINIERIEVLRGPSALLYGTGNFGGVINYVTKKPVFGKDFYHFGTMVGSHDLLRFEMDANIPLANENSSWAKYKPSFRISGAWQENGDFTDLYKQTFWQINGVLSFKPFENTTVTIGGEYGHKEETGVGFQNVRNSYGGLSANRAYLWLTDTYDEETGIKTGETVNNRTFRWSGDDTYVKGPFKNVTFDLEHKFNDHLYFKTGYSRSSSTFDSRMIDAWVTAGGGLTEGSGYTNIWTGETIPDRTGDLWSHMVTASYGDIEGNDSPDAIDNAVMQYEWVDDVNVTDRDQLRAELVYQADLGKWGNHTLILGTSYEQTKQTEDIYRPGQTFVMSYIDDGIVRNGGTHTVNNYNRFSYKDIDDQSYFTYGTQGDGYSDNPRVHWTSEETKTWDAGYYFVYQAQFFDDHLTFVGGTRYDRVDSSSVLEYTWANELYENGMTDMGKTNRYSGRTGSDAPSATSPQIGLSYAINDSLSVFGVYSTGIVPNFDYHDGNDEMLDPSEVENIEVGIKFELFDGKLSGSISAYKIERENVAKYIWWAPNPSNSIADGYDANATTGYTAKYATPAAFYAGIFESALDKNLAIETAKQIWGEGWWGLIDEVASVTYDGSTLANDFDWSATDSNGNLLYPLANDFWNYYGDGATTLAATLGENGIIPGLYFCETGHDNSRLEDEVWFPLLQWGVNDTIDEFMSAILFANGWMGNYGQATNGQSYKYGDGTVGVANSSTGVGAWVPMSDESKGVDIQLTWSPIPEFQLLMSYSYLKREITSTTYQLVSAKFAPGAEWLKSDYAAGSLDPSLTAYDVYDDINDASTYHAVIPDTGLSGDDSPENTFSMWCRYNLSHLGDATANWAIGAGCIWEDKRNWYSGFMGDGNATYVSSTRTLVQYWTDERISFNAMIEYKLKLDDKYNARLALNIDNLLDDKDIYGLVYAPGRSFKFSCSIDF